MFITLVKKLIGGGGVENTYFNDRKIIYIFIRFSELGG